MSKSIVRLISLVFLVGFVGVYIVQGQMPEPSPTPLPTGAIVPIGKIRAADVITRLQEIGDTNAVNDIKKALKATANKNAELGELNFAAAGGTPKPYQYATQVFGFIPATAMSSGDSSVIDVVDAGSITPDVSLKGLSIKVTLDRFRVADYPGDGEHLVLFDFYAQHQVTEVKEDLHFTQTYRAPEGQGPGVRGSAIFVGLKLSNEGVNFKFKTVNVSNEDDEKLLEFLNGDQFKNGIQLLNSVNPLVPIVTGFATGLFKSIASRHKNIPVQDAEIGLDFSNIPLRAALREGSYIAVQAPPGPWDWSKWKFNRSTGEVVSVADNTMMIPFNYIVFSISKMQ